MTDDRIDFSPLDPTEDAERFERIVRSIMAAAARPLATRGARASVVGQLGLWWRPLLAAAAITGIVSIGALTRFQTSTMAEPEIGLAEAIGMPDQIAEWVRSDEVPTTAELLVALEEES
jgi:hypothetical protein